MQFVFILEMNDEGPDRSSHSRCSVGSGADDALVLCGPPHRRTTEALISSHLHDRQS